MKKKKFTPEELFQLPYEEFKEVLVKDLKTVPIKDKNRYMEKLETTIFHWIMETNKNDDFLKKLNLIDDLRSKTTRIKKSLEKEEGLGEQGK